MIGPVLLLTATGVPVLGTIGRQQLPAQGCAAFLWRADAAIAGRGLTAMVGADPAMLRLAIDGHVVDLPRVAQHGETLLGMPAAADYRGAGVAASLTLTVVARPDLRDGAGVPQAALRLTGAGGDELVVPLAGLVGCRPHG